MTYKGKTTRQPEKRLECLAQTRMTSGGSVEPHERELNLCTCENHWWPRGDTELHKKRKRKKQENAEKRNKKRRSF